MTRIKKADTISMGIRWVLCGHAIVLLIPLAHALNPKNFMDTRSTNLSILSLASWLCVFQFVYVGPMVLYACVKSLKEALKGVLIAFGITLLLSTITCGVGLSLTGGKLF